MNALRGGSCLLLIIINTVVWCTPLYLLGTVRLLLRGGPRRTLGRWLDGIVQCWVRGNRGIFALLHITRIDATWENDAAVSPENWYVVLSNHQSWADIMILQNLFWGRLPTLKFFTKRQLIWVPFIGIAMWLLGFPYVRRLSRAQIEANPALAGLDRQATLDACDGFRSHPTAVLAFLEGSRFTAVKHAAQDARFERLLNPKVGGVSYVVATLKDRLHAVLDVTLSYPEGVPTFWELLQGRCKRVNVLIQCQDLPPAVLQAVDSDDVRARLGPWIETLWQSKDVHLKQSNGQAG